MNLHKKKGWIFESVGITEKNFVQTIKNEAKLKYDLNLSSDVLNILKEILSPDYNSINNILAQLSLFAGQAGQNEISPSIVAQLTNYTPELVLFDVIKKSKPVAAAKFLNCFLTMQGKLKTVIYSRLSPL